VSPGDVEPHFKLYIILTLVLFFSSCDVLGTIYVFSLAFYTYTLYVSGNKARVVPVHTINTYESGGIAPFILNFSTTFPSCFTHRRKSLWSALDRRLGCLQNQAGCFGEERNFCLTEN